MKNFLSVTFLLFASISVLSADQSATIKMTPLNGMDEKMSFKINKMQGPFYFVDAPLFSVFAVLEKLLDRPIIYSSTLPQTAKFTFKSEKQMSNDDAIKLFRAMLMLNGIAIISVDDKYYKAVTATGVSSHIPEFLMGRASDQKPSQDFYTKFFELNHIQISDIESKLKSSMSPNNVGVFETFPKSNSFWVTDTLLNLQRIEAILDKLDVSINETAFIQIKNSAASEIRDKITSLKLDELKNVTITADTRTNKLIVVAPEAAINKINELVKELDTESEAVLKSEVVYVKHGEAVKVVEVLTKIVSGQKQSKSNKTTQSPNRDKQQTPQSTDKKIKKKALLRKLPKLQNAKSTKKMQISA